MKRKIVDGFEVRIMIGCPASGKTAWANDAFSDRSVVVSHDACRRWEVVEYLLLGLKQSFVSDATHPNVERRAALIAAARATGAKVIACYRTTDMETAFRWNGERPERRRVPNVAIREYFLLFEEPTLDEGFDEIVRM